MSEAEYFDIPYFLRAPGAVGEDVAREFKKLKKRIGELEAGIKTIAPWLSASLTDHEHDGKGDYLTACNEIFNLDQRKNEYRTTIKVTK